MESSKIRCSKDSRSHMRIVSVGFSRGSPANPRPFTSFPDAQLENSLRMMREQMNRAMGGDCSWKFPGKHGGDIFQSNSTIRMTDSQGSIEILSSSGDTKVTVRNERNETVWSGPWNNEDDKSSAPQEIRERIEKVNSGSGTGFSFRFGQTPGRLSNCPGTEFRVT